MGADRGERQPESPRDRRRVHGKRGIRKDLFGGGAIGSWTEEELANIPEWSAPPEEATRDQEDSDALRKGIAIEGRRKRVGTRKLGEASPYGAGERGPKRRAEGDRDVGGRDELERDELERDELERDELERDELERDEVKDRRSE